MPFSIYLLFHTRFFNASFERISFYRLEEVTAQANTFSRLIEQREKQVRGLKTRLEEAVHQNNKMTHAAELKDDKIQTLEKRCGFNYIRELSNWRPPPPPSRIT